MKFSFHRLSRLEIIALLTALVLFSLAVEIYVSQIQDRANDVTARIRASAASSLDNCQQIEVIKSEIRKTVSASMVRLPKVDYYKTHPDELAQAIKDTKASANRFSADDCYKLPLVKLAHLMPPKKKGS